MDRSKLAWLVDLLPLIVGVLLVVALAGTWAGRMGHPYDLEWMEGGLLAHAWRLQHGLPIYVEPSAEFIPYIYPPGMAALLAGLAHLFDLGHPLGRALSLFGVISGAFAMVYGVGRHGRSWSLGLASAMVFLGCYGASGAFYDLVRNDGVLVGLLSWSIVFAMDERRGASMASGLLLAAAFLVKHNAALFGFPIVLGVWARGGWREALRFAAWSAIPALVSTIWLQVVTDGYFLTYILAVPATHGLVSARVFPGFFREMGAHLPVALVVIFLFLTWRSARLVEPGRRWVIWVPAVGVGSIAASVGMAMPDVKGILTNDGWMSIVGLGAIAGSLAVLVVVAGGRALRRIRVPWTWTLGVGIGATALLAGMLMRGHYGGYLNVYVPVHWVLVLAFGMALARSREALPGWVGLAVPAVLVAAQLGLQLADLDDARLLPTPADREAGDALVERLRDVEGPVWSPHAPWLPVQAGHDPSFHLIALWDIDHKVGPLVDGAEAVRQSVDDHYWGTILVARSPGRTQGMGYGVGRSYRVLEELDLERGVLVPKTGWRVRPHAILVPAWSPGAGPGDYPVATTGVELSRRDFQTERVWEVLDLVPGEPPTWGGVPVDDVERRASGVDQVWLRVPRATPTEVVGPVLAQLARAGVVEVHLAVAGDVDRALVLSPAPPVVEGAEGLGVVMIASDPGSGRVAIGPMVAPPGSDVTLDLDGLEALWEILGDLPPRIPVAALPESGCDLQCAVDALEDTRGIQGMEGASLAVGWPRVPAGEVTEDVDLEALAESIRSWGTRAVRLPE